jgi:ribulose-phosphate 3-epimerase
MTCGPSIVSALPDRFVNDVHLTIGEPRAKIGSHVEAGAGIITIHMESSRHHHRILQRLAGMGLSAALPSTRART